MVDIKENIKEYAKKTIHLIERNQKMNEPNTKEKIIRPFIEILGWDTSSDDVELEFSIQLGTSTAHADYALMVDNKPFLFIEAKGLDNDIQESHIKQVISYCLVERVNWCIITNGNELRVYNSKWGKNPEDCLFFMTSVKRYDQDCDKILLLEKDSIINGELDKKASEMIVGKKILKAFKEHQEDIVKKVSNLIKIHTGLDKKVITPQILRLFSSMPDYSDDTIVVKAPTLAKLGSSFSGAILKIIKDSGGEAHVYKIYDTIVQYPELKGPLTDDELKHKIHGTISTLNLSPTVYKPHSC
jgi:hypothetical protein